MSVVDSLFKVVIVKTVFSVDVDCIRGCFSVCTEMSVSDVRLVFTFVKGFVNVVHVFDCFTFWKRS